MGDISGGRLIFFPTLVSLISVCKLVEKPTVLCHLDEGVDELVK